MLDAARMICTDKSGSWNEGKRAAEPFQIDVRGIVGIH